MLNAIVQKMKFKREMNNRYKQAKTNQFITAIRNKIVDINEIKLEAYYIEFSEYSEDHCFVLDGGYVIKIDGIEVDTFTDEDITKVYNEIYDLLLLLKHENGKLGYVC